MSTTANRFSSLLHLVRLHFGVSAAVLIEPDGPLACDGIDQQRAARTLVSGTPQPIARCPIADGGGELLLFDDQPREVDQQALAEFASLASELFTRRREVLGMREWLRVLREKEQRLALAVAGSGTGIWDRDVVNGLIHYSPGWKSLLGYADDEIGTRIEDAYVRVHADDLEYVRRTMLDHFESRSDQYKVEHRLRHKDGHFIWVSSRGRVVERDDQGRPLRMIGTTTDITEMKRMGERLEQNLELLTELTNEIPGMVFQYMGRPDGSGSYRYISAGSLDVYGLSPEQLKLPNGRERILALVHPDDLPAYQNSLETSALALTPWQMEYRVQIPGRPTGWRQGNAHPKRLADGSVLWHGFITDITEQKRIEVELQALATTDFLTQLPNRRHFMARLEEELARLQRAPGRGAVLLMCDLDHFKVINDRWGHGVGDDALRHFAALLAGQMRRVDLAGRMGGEEFAVLLNEADHASALVFAQRLQQQMLETPLRHQGEVIPLTVSIGITTLDAGDANAEAALSRSDLALYRAKAEGRNRIEMH
ncbi:sensor domain-containing diguanylate cyclase [Pseudomonas sp. TUM22785]|uniref:sensor domain-containing diguanylate cyclase n=1 Tax=Pseudomonas sp. TUM22785 TaxID=3019098 RepID=UPI0023052C06|nr:sensor domain-containing diguanylate cyclase [Pseudomonas sp. TUM22785]WCD83032.1 diguanylate cyclase [Pseudomonas sp. TUM22785]